MDISVIIPAYNSEKFISKTIESVLYQKFEGTFEVLVANDASTDSTPVIISDYQSKYPNIIKATVRENNIGYSANYYDLINKASGKYLAVLDHDDVWLSDVKLQKQFNFLESHPEIGMLCGDVKLIDEEGNEEKVVERETEGVLSLTELMMEKTYLYSPTLMMRTSVLKRMVDEEDCSWYIENKSFYDDMWAFYFAYKSKIYWMKDCLAAYRNLKNSGCHSTKVNEQFELSKRYYKLKLHFLLTHDIIISEKEQIFLNEYDKLYKESYYKGEMSVRSSKSYRIIKLIRSLKFWK